MYAVYSVCSVYGIREDRRKPSNAEIGQKRQLLEVPFSYFHISHRTSRVIDFDDWWQIKIACFHSYYINLLFMHAYLLISKEPHKYLSELTVQRYKIAVYSQQVNFSVL